MAANNDDSELQLKRQLWSELNKEEDEIEWSLVLQILRQNENAVRWTNVGGTDPDNDDDEDLDFTSTVLYMACEKSAPFVVVQEIHDLWPGAKNEAADEGWLPIHTACRRENYHESLRVIELLIGEENAHATLNTRNKIGWLPLHLACFADQPIEVFLLLIERGGQETVQVAKGHFGWLPLHIACQFGHCLDVIKLLVKLYPQATRIRDSYGRLPMYYARVRQSFYAWEIVRWLEDREAKLERVSSIFSHVRNLDDTAVEELKQLFTRLKSCSGKKRRIDQV